MHWFVERFQLFISLFLVKEPGPGTEISTSSLKRTYSHVNNHIPISIILWCRYFVKSMDIFENGTHLKHIPRSEQMICSEIKWTFYKQRFQKGHVYQFLQLLKLCSGVFDFFWEESHVTVVWKYKYFISIKTYNIHCLLECWSRFFHSEWQGYKLLQLKFTGKGKFL